MPLATGKAEGRLSVMLETTSQTVSRVALTPAQLRERTTVSVDEAAGVLGCGRRQAYEMVHDGTLPTIRVGRSFRVPAAHLVRVLGLDGAA